MSDSTMRLGLQMAGTAIGGYFGGPVGAAIGGSIGGYAGMQLFPPDVPDGPRLDDLKVQSSAYGAPIPVVFGNWRLSGNVIWSAGIKEHKSEESVGKGSGPTRTTYSYTASFAVAFCEGPITGFVRVWADSTLIWDATDSANARQILLDWIAGNTPGDASFYLGSESQEPDPVIEGHEGAGEVPAHRGLAYIVFEDLDLEPYGNRIPSITAEVAVDGQYDWVITGGWPKEDLDQGPGGDGRDYQIGPYEDGVFRFTKNSGNQGSTDTDVEGARAWCDYSGDVVAQEYLDIEVPEEERVGGSKAAARVYRGGRDPGLIHWREDSSGDRYLHGSNGTLLQSDWVYKDGEHLDQVAAVLATPRGQYFFLQDNAASRSDARKAPRLVGPGGYLDLEKTTGGESPFWRGAAWDPAEERVIGVHDNDPDYGLACYVWDHQMNEIAKLDVDGDWGDYTGPMDVYAEAVWVWQGESGKLERWELDFDEEKFTPAGESIQLGEGTLGRNDNQYFIGDLRAYREDVLVTVSHGLIYRAFTASDYPLADALAGICERAGLSSDDYDTSKVDADLRGFAHTRPVEAKQDLAPLLDAYAIDAVESDGVLRFVPRGGDPVATIPAEDLGVGESGGAEEAVATTRLQELELPRRVGVQYADPGMRYEQGEQYAARVTTKAVTERTQSLPVALTAKEAAGLAQQMLAAEWVGRERHSWATSMRWAHLDPGDVVRLEAPEATYISRILSADAALPRRMAFSGVREDAATYQTNATAEAGRGEETRTGAVGPTAVRYLDIPPLRDRDDEPGYYVAAAGYLDGWSGADILRRNASGGWDTVSAVTEAAAIGNADTVLGSARPTVWDDGNTVTVHLIAGSAPTSAADLVVLAGANHALLGDEIIAYADVTDHGDGSYTLGRLLRGRFGTEWAIDEHSYRERFVGLSSALSRYAIERDQINAEQTLRAVSFRGSLDAAEDRTVDGGGAALMPYAPAHIEARMEGAGDLRVTWVRRARLDGEWRDYVDVTHDDGGTYEVRLLDDDGEEVATTQTATDAPDTALLEGVTSGYSIEPLRGYTVEVYAVPDTVARGFKGAITI
ncbi:MAG: phage tail protein [Thiohalorhabdus sp.]|uniref:phage tail protein n=1 Tax=Thiohalorhabdus sp. TaxID=3094134 RepID=UPI00397FA891